MAGRGKGEEWRMRGRREMATDESEGDGIGGRGGVGVDEALEVSGPKAQSESVIVQSRSQD